MTQFITAARTGTCEKCRASLTYVLSLQALTEVKQGANRVPYSCPSCGHSGTLEAMPGHWIMRVETRLYPQP
jgi:RNase P subunit RPR2